MTSDTNVLKQPIRCGFGDVRMFQLVFIFPVIVESSERQKFWNVGSSKSRISWKKFNVFLLPGSGAAGLVSRTEMIRLVPALDFLIG